MPLSFIQGRRRFWVGVAALVVAAGGLVAAAGGLWRQNELPQGISKEEYANAERQFRAIYKRRPGHIDVLSVAGEKAVADGRLATAVACFAAIPVEDPRYGLAARLQEGQVFLRLNKAGDAERSFREFLSRAHRVRSVSADHLAAARKWLGYILSVELRLEERKDLLAAAHTDGQADVFDSQQYYFPNLLLWHTSTGRRRLTEFLAEDPENRLLEVAECRYLTAEGRLDEARAALEDFRNRHPGDLAGRAALLECLFEGNDWDPFIEAAKSLPEYTQDEPWFLTRMRGELAMHEHRWEQAVREFEHVLRADPANPWSQMGLARAYARLGRPEAQEEAQRRSLILAKIRVSLVKVKADNYDALLELASACQQLGFREAAQTFHQYASRTRPKDAAGTLPGIR